ncbi:hypothetical protein [Sporosarcina cascadiensis]|uniref:hypothetical protein n=1 Tax=Sporosarcina cascadiensis TaxID=2660747 RepID=UPI00129A7F51|nr:hypothetical protein [Sporosarcina cascadiensis]
MDRKAVQQEMVHCTVKELHEWKKHAEKCFQYYTKYWNEYEIEECLFIMTKIDGELQKREKILYENNSR